MASHSLSSVFKRTLQVAVFIWITVIYFVPEIECSFSQGTSLKPPQLPFSILVSTVGLFSHQSQGTSAIYKIEYEGSRICEAFSHSFVTSYIFLTEQEFYLA